MAFLPKLAMSSYWVFEVAARGCTLFKSNDLLAHAETQPQLLLDGCTWQCSVQPWKAEDML